MTIKAITIMNSIKDKLMDLGEISIIDNPDISFDYVATKVKLPLIMLYPAKEDITIEGKHIKHNVTIVLYHIDRENNFDNIENILSDILNNIEKGWDTIGDLPSVIQNYSINYYVYSMANQNSLIVNEIYIPIIFHETRI